MNILEEKVVVGKFYTMILCGVINVALGLSAVIFCAYRILLGFIAGQVFYGIMLLAYGITGIYYGCICAKYGSRTGKEFEKELITKRVDSKGKCWCMLIEATKLIGLLLVIVAFTEADSTLLVYLLILGTFVIHMISFHVFLHYRFSVLYLEAGRIVLQDFRKADRILEPGDFDQNNILNRGLYYRFCGTNGEMIADLSEKCADVNRLYQFLQNENTNGVTLEEARISDTDDSKYQEYISEKIKEKNNNRLLEKGYTEKDARRVKLGYILFNAIGMLGMLGLGFFEGNTQNEKLIFIFINIMFFAPLLYGIFVKEYLWLGINPFSMKKTSKDLLFSPVPWGIARGIFYLYSIGRKRTLFCYYVSGEETVIMITIIGMVFLSLVFVYIFRHCMTKQEVLLMSVAVCIAYYFISASFTASLVVMNEKETQYEKVQVVDCERYIQKEWPHRGSFVCKIVYENQKGEIQSDKVSEAIYEASQNGKTLYLEKKKSILDIEYYYFCIEK